jgi:hypothetical protein
MFEPDPARSASMEDVEASEKFIAGILSRVEERKVSTSVNLITRLMAL